MEEDKTMTGSYCIMQLEVRGHLKFPLGPGQHPGGEVQGTKPPKATRDPALYSTKKSLKIALSLCNFPVYFMQTLRKFMKIKRGSTFIISCSVSGCNLKKIIAGYICIRFFKVCSLRSSTFILPTQ